MAIGMGAMVPSPLRATQLSDPCAFAALWAPCAKVANGAQ